MDNRENQSNLHTLLSVLLNKLFLIIAIGVASAIVFALVTVFLITPLYSSTAKFYVNNTAGSGTTVTQTDINASKSLAETTIVVIKNNNEMLKSIIEAADVDISVNQLKKMISAGKYSGTEAFYINVSSASPADALALANAIQDIVPMVVPEIIKVGEIKSFDDPIEATEPDSPSLVINTAIGATLGIVISFLVFFLREVLDNTIYAEEDVRDRYGYPIIGIIPTITVDAPESSAGKRTKKKTVKKAKNKEEVR